MEKRFLTLNDIACYKRALKLAQYIWNIVNAWEWFAKKTIGIQYVKAIDSISATIAEGFGRFFKKDKILFYRYSNGSVMESLDWTEKAKKRQLLTQEQYQYILTELKALPKDIHHLIRFTNEKLEE